MDGMNDAANLVQKITSHYNSAVKLLGARTGVMNIFHDIGFVDARNALNKEILDEGVRDYNEICFANDILLDTSKRITNRDSSEFFSTIHKDIDKKMSSFYSLIEKTYEAGELMRLGLYKKD